MTNTADRRARRECRDNGYVPFEEMTPERWDRMIGINCGAYLPCRPCGISLSQKSEQAAEDCQHRLSWGALEGWEYLELLFRGKIWREGTTQSCSSQRNLDGASRSTVCAQVS